MHRDRWREQGGQRQGQARVCGAVLQFPLELSACPPPACTDHSLGRTPRWPLGGLDLGNAGQGRGVQDPCVHSEGERLMRAPASWWPRHLPAALWQKQGHFIPLVSSGRSQENICKGGFCMPPGAFLWGPLPVPAHLLSARFRLSWGLSGGMEW